MKLLFRKKMNKIFNYMGYAYTAFRILFRVSKWLGQNATCLVFCFVIISINYIITYLYVLTNRNTDGVMRIYQNNIFYINKLTKSKNNIQTTVTQGSNKQKSKNAIKLTIFNLVYLLF